MNQDHSSYNALLESCLESALNGSRSASKTFYSEFLLGPLYVPRRNQMHPLSDNPKYPNEFMDLLGIQAGDRVFVPVFSKFEYIEFWCGNPLEVRKINGQELIQLIPDDWWIIFNPGREVEKEISPWETDLLRKGGESVIDEIVSELHHGQFAESIKVRQLEKDDFVNVRNTLINSAKSAQEIQAIYLLIEDAIDTEGKTINALLVGIQVLEDVDLEKQKIIETQLEEVVSPLLIGGLTCKFFSGYGIEQSVLLGLFKNVEPIYFDPKQIKRPFSRFNPLNLFK